MNVADLSVYLTNYSLGFRCEHFIVNVTGEKPLVIVQWR